MEAVWLTPLRGPIRFCLLEVLDEDDLLTLGIQLSLAVASLRVVGLSSLLLADCEEELDEDFLVAKERN